MFRPQSLVTRHLLASLVLLPALLGFSAYALDKAFKNSLRSAEYAALKVQLYGLLGAAEPADDSLFIPEALTEPRFNSPESGLYAKVTNVFGMRVWQSTSLTISGLHLAADANIELSAGDDLFDEVTVGDKTYFRFIYDTVWEINEKDRYFRFYLFHSQDNMNNELAEYRKTLWMWMGGLALLMISTQIAVVYWGFKPLKELAAQLSLFQAGKASYLQGNYPKEIEPITTNLNLLLESERNQRKKYKNTLSDLAHSLKTPLAIMRSNLNNPSGGLTTETQNKLVEEQISRMTSIIEHQLRRATTISTNVHQVNSNIFAIAERLGNALAKVYADKNITFNNNVLKNIDYVGDENDLMELLGNLIDNAFKYGESAVYISADITGSKNKELNIIIEDDGPGIAENMRKEILSRGARADTAMPGQGIGLAVSVDIASSYNGSIEVKESRYQGAAFYLRLPMKS